MTERATRTVAGDRARRKLLAGMRAVAVPVASTMGPSGQTVAIAGRAEGEPPHVTRDGVTVCRGIEPACPVGRIGVGLLRDAAGRAEAATGDGTSTCIVVAAAMAEQANRLLIARAKRDEIRRELPAALSAAVEAVRECSQAAPTLELVARISAAGDEAIASAAAGAVTAAGAHGRIEVEGTTLGATHVRVADGVSVRGCILASQFSTSRDSIAAAVADASVALCRGTLRSFDPVIDEMKRCAAENRWLVVVADDYDPDAVRALAKNRASGLRIVACRAQLDREVLSDAARALGGTAWDLDVGTKGSVGRAARFYADRTRISVTPADPASLAALQAEVTAERAAADTAAAARALEARLERIAGRAATLVVAGPTEAEVGELVRRAEDAVGACRAASIEGALPGGSARALWIAAEAVEKRLPGVTASIVAEGLRAPARAILASSGLSEAEWSARIAAGAACDLSTGTWSSPTESAVWDPTAVSVHAVECAGSVCRTFVALSGVVVEVQR